MTDFDSILEKCLAEIGNDSSNLDECLQRYPEHSAQLEPLLRTAIYLKQGSGARPSAAFKARARAKLTLHMQAHPRKSARMGFMFWKIATGFAVVVFALLASGTAFAQSALPGDAFYSWKLISEHAWRAVTFDPIRTDIAIANRRINEMNAVAGDPVKNAEALAGYVEVVKRLESELDAGTLKGILPEIDIQQNPSGDSTQPLSVTPTPEPISTPVPILSTLVVPNVMPNIIPTIQFPLLAP